MYLLAKGNLIMAGDFLLELVSESFFYRELLHLYLPERLVYIYIYIFLLLHLYLLSFFYVTSQFEKFYFYIFFTGLINLCDISPGLRFNFLFICLLVFFFWKVISASISLFMSSQFISGTSYTIQINFL